MSADKPIIIYTCIFGLYDRELAQAVDYPRLKFVCFTDTPDKIRAPGWEMRPFASPSALTDGHYINRYHKFFPHRLFPEHRWSIYVDGNIRFDGEWTSLAESLSASGQPVGAFWHRSGHTLDTEIDACREHRFGARDFAVVESQVAAYKAAGVDFAQAIPTCNLLVRDHAAAGLDVAMSLWWAQIFEFTKRDQVSFLYALQTARAGWHALDAEVDTNLVRTVWHKPPLGQRVARRLRKELGLSRKIA